VNRWFVVLLLSNVVDAISTAYVLTHNLAKEYNPIVQFLYGWHPYIFFAVKTVAIAVAAVVVAEQPEKHRLTLSGVTVFYVLLALYQLTVVFSH